MSLKCHSLHKTLLGFSSWSCWTGNCRCWQLYVVTTRWRCRWAQLWRQTQVTWCLVYITRLTLQDVTGKTVTRWRCRQVALMKQVWRKTDHCSRLSRPNTVMYWSFRNCARVYVMRPGNSNVDLLIDQKFPTLEFEWKNFYWLLKNWVVSMTSCHY